MKTAANINYNGTSLEQVKLSSFWNKQLFTESISKEIIVRLNIAKSIIRWLITFDLEYTSLLFKKSIWVVAYSPFERRLTKKCNIVTILREQTIY